MSTYVRGLHRTWAKVRTERACRICGRERPAARHFQPPKNGWVTGHHLVPRSQGGGNSEDNIVPLCWECHRIVDSAKPVNSEARHQRRAVLRARLTPAEVDYCIRTMGADWLDRNYPRQEGAARGGGVT